MEAVAVVTATRL